MPVTWVPLGCGAAHLSAGGVLKGRVSEGLEGELPTETNTLGCFQKACGRAAS